MSTIKLPSVKSGDTWTFVFEWKNNNVPINLTNCTARMQVRTRRTGVLLAEASTATSTISIDGAAGQVSVAFPTAATELVDPGMYESDLEITFPVSGNVQSSETMIITVEGDITR